MIFLWHHLFTFCYSTIFTLNWNFYAKAKKLWYFLILCKIGFKFGSQGGQKHTACRHLVCQKGRVIKQRPPKQAQVRTSKKKARCDTGIARGATLQARSKAEKCPFSITFRMDQECFYLHLPRNRCRHHKFHARQEYKEEPEQTTPAVAAAQLQPQQQQRGEEEQDDDLSAFFEEGGF